MDARTWRLFLGLWPDDATRAAIVQHASGWHWTAEARTTRAELLHITLHFIGEVENDRVAGLRHALAVPWKGCRLLLNRAQVWPGGIAVLEASAVPGELAALHEQLAKALAGEDLPVEERRYRPHVTLARKAQGAKPPARFAALAWQVDSRYLLLRSLPGGQGYQPLQVFG